MTTIEFSGVALPRRRAFSPFHAIAAAFRRWSVRRAERRAVAALRELDDLMLRDLGLSRSDIVAAVRGEVRLR